MSADKRQAQFGAVEVTVLPALTQVTIDRSPTELMQRHMHFTLHNEDEIEGALATWRHPKTKVSYSADMVRALEFAVQVIKTHKKG